MASNPVTPVEPPGIFPAPPGVTPNYINPVVKDSGFVPLAAVFTPIATICLVLRLYTKAQIIRLLGGEDAAITVAWMANVAMIGIFINGLRIGNGAHIWNMTLAHFEPYTKTLTAGVVLSQLAAGLPKVSILLYYLRVNPDKGFRYSTMTVLWMTCASIIIYLCIFLFQCHPVKKLWYPFIPGSCLGLNPVYLSQPIVSVLLDVLIVALPIPMVYNLQVDRRTKLLLQSIFTLSGCTIITGIVRIWSTAELQGTMDTTWNTMLSQTLTAVEYNLSIICSCLMVLRPFCRRHLPFLLGSKRSRRTGDSPGADGVLHYDGPSGPQSRSNYRTKVSSGGRSGGLDGSKKSGKRGLFSSLGGTLGKDDYDDLESLSVELKDHGSHAQGVQQPSSKNSIERKVGEDSVSTPAAWPLQEHVQKPVRSKSRTQPPPPPSQAQDGNVILKTVSLDVR